MARTAAERLRIYGPPERVEFVQNLGCIICGQPAVNAHTATGGLSRKADYTTIANLCHAHHDESHRGVKTFERKYGLDLKAVAASVEAAWRVVSTQLTEGE